MGSCGSPWTGACFEHRDVFAAPPPDQASMTIDGVDGILYGLAGATLQGKASRFGGAGTAVYRLDTGAGGALYELSSALTVSSDAYLHELLYLTASASNARKFGTYLNVPGSGSEDFKAEVEPQLFAAVRFGDGRKAWWRYDDDSDPYLSEAASADQRALVDAKFVGASVDLDYRAGRLDKRCPDDPLNPWVPKPSLGVVGLDGQGLEWIHSLAATDDAIPAGEIPPNALPYDAARNEDGDDVGVRIVGGAVSKASSGGRVWHDEEQQTTADSPFDAAMFRVVTGQPARGAVPGGGWGDWLGPVFRRLWAADGQDGEDGAGWERVFALTATSDEPTVEPSDSAAYDSYPAVPPTPQANTIYDGLPSVTADLPYGWVAERSVPGTPAKRAAHDDSWGDWSDWELREHYGQDGDDGEDGAGWERVFALTTTGDEPSVEPSDSAAYDSYPAVPRTPQANTIYDGLPSVTADLPYGWVAERSVPGTPAKDAAHEDSWGDWSDWTLREHYGQDGEDGEDGGDGAGKEWCYAVTDTADPPSATPSPTARYDSFRRVPSSGPSANTIYDDYPGVSADHPWGWVNVRKVPGTPARGAAKQASWGDWGGWKLHEHYGQDPVTVSRSNVVRKIPWDSATNGWVSQRNLFSDTVTWYRGTRVLDSITVKLDTRPGSRGQGQCRMELSGVGTSPPVKVDNRTIPGGTYSTGWANAPCEHDIEVEGVICTFVVELGERPAAGRGPTVFFTWTSGTDYIVGDVIVFRTTASGGYFIAQAYRCIKAHTAATGNRPNQGTSWRTYWVLA